MRLSNISWVGLCFCLVLLAMGVESKGKLYVDNVYSSSESTISVDNLSSNEGTVTGLATTRLVAFESFPSLSVSSPDLIFGSSFVSFSTQNDVNFISNKGSASLTSAQDVDINGGSASIEGGDVTSVSRGELSFLARETVSLFGDSLDIAALNGGAHFDSVAGPITVDADADLSFNADDVLSARARDDVALRSSGNVVMNADDIRATSEDQLSLSSSSSMSFFSNRAGIEFQSHDMAVTVGGFSAVGGGEARLGSLGDELDVFGFAGASLKSLGGDVNVVGVSDGATFISSDGDNGGVSVSSAQSNIIFTSRGSGEQSHVSVDADTLDGTFVNGVFLDAGRSAHVAGERMQMSSASVKYSAQRDGNIFSNNRMSYTAGTSFGVTADLILLNANSDVDSDAAAGQIYMTSFVSTANVGSVLTFNGEDFTFKAGEGDIDFSVGSDLVFKADYTDGRDQVASLSGSDLDMQGGDFVIKGGDVRIAGGSQSMTSKSDWSIQADYEPASSYTEFRGVNSQSWNVASWTHNSGPTFWSQTGTPNGEVLQPSTAKFSFSDSITLRSGDLQDFTIDDGATSVSSDSDIIFTLGRDLVFSVKEDASFNSSSSVIVTMEDLYSSSERLTVLAGDGVGTTSNLDFNVGRDTIFTTDRNEATDDFMVFNFTGAVALNVDNVVFNAAEYSDFTGQDITIDANEFVLGSGVLQDINFNTGSNTFKAGDQFSFDGNSVTFMADVGDFTLTSNSLSSISASRGVEMISNGTLSWTTEAGSFVAQSYDEILLSGKSIELRSGNGTNILASEDILVRAVGGALSMSSGAVDILAGRNMSFVAGDDGQVSVKAGGDFQATTTDVFTAGVASGPLGITSTVGDVLFTSDRTLIGAGDFSSTSNDYFMQGGNIFYQGGDVLIKSTVTDVVFKATGALDWESRRTTLSGTRFDNEMDGVSVTAGDSVSLSSTFDLVSFVAGDSFRMDVQAVAPINLGGQDIYISSTLENQDVMATAGNAMSISAPRNIRFTSDGDFSMVAAGAIALNQTDLLIESRDDMSVTSDLGRVSITQTGGERILVTATSEDSIVPRDNVIELLSTSRAQYTAGTGMQFLANGADEPRRKTVGDSNALGNIRNLVGLSIRTYEPEAPIYFDSRNDRVDTFAGKNLALRAQDIVEINTQDQQTYTAEAKLNVVAEDGFAFFLGPSGIKMESDEDAYLLSSRYTDFLAGEAFTAYAGQDLLVRSYTGDIEFINFEESDTVILAGGNTNYYAGSRIDFLAQGDIQSNAGQEYNANGNRGYSLRAFGDQLSFTTGDNGVITSSEETFFSAGGEFRLTNQAIDGGDLSFLGNGVVFATTGGDMSFSTADSDITFTMFKMLINAFGTSEGGRDAAEFVGTDGKFTAGRNISIDATEFVKLGTATNPAVISITGTGTPDFTGVRIGSGGSILYTSDTSFNVTSGATTRINSVARSAFTGGDNVKVASTNGNIRYEAPQGIISLNVAQDLLETATKSNRQTGKFLNRYDTGDLTFDVTAGSFAARAMDFENNINGDMITALPEKAVYQSTKEDGTADFNIVSDFVANVAANLNQIADDTIDLNIAQATTYTLTADTTFKLTGADSELDLGTQADMLIDVTGTISMTSYSTSFTNLDPDDSISITADDSAVSTVGDSLLVRGNKDLSIRAGTTGKFTADQEFRVETTNDITIDMRGTITVVTSSTEIIATQENEGDIDIDATTITYSFNPETNTPVLFRAEENLLIQAGASSTFTGTGNTEFRTSGRAPLSVTAGNEIKFTAVPTVTFQAGDESVPGSVFWNAENIDMDFVSSLLLLGDADALSPFADVRFNADQYVLSSTGRTDFVAKSDVEEQQGTIRVESQGNAVLTAQTTMSFLSEEAGIEVLSEGNVGFTATAGAGATFTVNTNGADSGIVVEGRNALVLPVFGGNILLSAGTDALFTDQVAANINSETTLTIGTVGPAGDEAVGVRFKTNKERGAMSFLSNSMTMSATSGIEMTSTDLLSSVSQAEIEINSPTTTFVSSGKTVAPEGYGMLITAPKQTYTIGGSTEWVSQANFIASGTFLNSGTTTNDFLISSVGDVEIGPNGAAGANYKITTPYLRASGGRGMQITNANGNVNIAGQTMRFNTGTTEDYSTVRVGISGSNNAITTTTPGTGGTTRFLADNNILLTGNSKMDWATTAAVYSRIRFTATKGDILFRSTSINPANHDLHVEATGTNSVVYITAFHRIDNRQHQTLGFFQPESQTARTSFAAAQQGTTNILPNLQLRLPDPLRLNDCRCSTAVGGGCGNIECPDTTNRILQMQEALVSYGLLIFA